MVFKRINPVKQSQTQGLEVQKSKNLFNKKQVLAECLNNLNASLRDTNNYILNLTKNLPADKNELEIERNTLYKYMIKLNESIAKLNSIVEPILNRKNIFVRAWESIKKFPKTIKTAFSNALIPISLWFSEKSLKLGYNKLPKEIFPISCKVLYPGTLLKYNNVNLNYKNQTSFIINFQQYYKPKSFILNLIKKVKFDVAKKVKFYVAKPMLDLFDFTVDTKETSFGVSVYVSLNAKNEKALEYLKQFRDNYAKIKASYNKAGQSLPDIYMQLDNFTKQIQSNYISNQANEISSMEEKYINKD